MGMQNIKDAIIASDGVSQAFKMGDTKKALEIIERNSGIQARELCERLIKYGMTPEELGRLFAKISDYIENAVGKFERNQRFKEYVEKQVQIAVEQKARAAEEQAKRIAAEQKKADEDWKRFERRLADKRKEREKLMSEHGKLSAEHKKLETENKKLKEQHKKEKDAKKRKKIEARIKKNETRQKKIIKEQTKKELRCQRLLKEEKELKVSQKKVSLRKENLQQRRQKLQVEQEKLEILQQQNQSRNYASDKPGAETPQTQQTPSQDITQIQILRRVNGGRS